ncbi:hepatic lectin-like [Poeciliopsis prolifica]|uniref:hepatic lectin-like n=1 Tax=Poeciliopsis prolifica TaxID=188132 RepID=UPI0024140D85|nr:hepatic lectin-like [Poeciliopsis prolifica]
MRHSQRYTEGENPSRTCRMSAERVVLLVLVGLLAAALIVIYRLSFAVLMTNQTVQTLKEENEALQRNQAAFDRIHTNQTFQSLKQENEALRRNLSGKCPPAPAPSTCQPAPAFPPPTAVNMKISCLKCGPGWELNHNKCYYFSTTKSSWNDSRRSCINLGSDLVKIDSREEQAFLVRRVADMMAYNNDMFWIGLTDSDVEDRWSWMDGSPLEESFNFWSYTPDDWKGSRQQHPEGEDCATMGTKGEPEKQKCWADVFCFLPQNSICEKTPETGQTFCV